MSLPAERRIGNVIAGKWRVDSLLGAGSMASVYSVTHRNGARAALKILHPQLCADTSVCERFLGEGYLTNAVKHSGICRVLDDGVTDDGCVFLVMDLLEGRTLEAYREECGGQVALGPLLDIADKLMDVLRAVHQAGIVHRDLKLQNVFVCNDGTVKLLDFGVARLFEPGAASKHSVFGMVLGTPSFMSPEQALGAREKVDHRSDIWSLGATLFTSLTGQTVHLGPHLQARLLAAATVQARSIAIVRQDLPASVAAAIDRALRFDREERWQSVDAFRRALRDARAELGLGKPETVPPPAWIDDDGPAPLADDDPDGTEKTLVAEAAGPALAAAQRLRPSLPDVARPLSPQVAVRKSGLATWIAGAVVAGAITGGAGFYLLRTPPADAAHGAARAPSSSAPVAVTPPSAPQLPAADAKEGRDPGRAAVASDVASTSSADAGHAVAAAAEAHERRAPSRLAPTAAPTPEAARAAAREPIAAATSDGGAVAAPAPSSEAAPRAKPDAPARADDGATTDATEPAPLPPTPAPTRAAPAPLDPFDTPN